MSIAIRNRGKASKPLRSGPTRWLRPQYCWACFIGRIADFGQVSESDGMRILDPEREGTACCAHTSRRSNMDACQRLCGRVRGAITAGIILESRSRPIPVFQPMHALASIGPVLTFPLCGSRHLPATRCHPAQGPGAEAGLPAVATCRWQRTVTAMARRGRLFSTSRTSTRGRGDEAFAGY